MAWVLGEGTEWGSGPPKVDQEARQHGWDLRSEREIRRGLKNWKKESRSLEILDEGKGNVWGPLKEKAQHDSGPKSFRQGGVSRVGGEPGHQRVRM